MRQTCCAPCARTRYTEARRAHWRVRRGNGETQSRAEPRASWPAQAQTKTKKRRRRRRNRQMMNSRPTRDSIVSTMRHSWSAPVWGVGTDEPTRARHSSASASHTRLYRSTGPCCRAACFETAWRSVRQNQRSTPPRYHSEWLKWRAVPRSTTAQPTCCRRVQRAAATPVARPRTVPHSDRSWACGAAPSTAS